jgi:hypothetical protein
VATELGGTQVTSLLETLPGIAAVLRNPVADAFVNTIRAGARLGEFKLADAEEILRYAVRRNLMTQDETDRVLAEIKLAADRRAEKALEREKGKVERDRLKKVAAAHKPVPAVAKALKAPPKKPVGKKPFVAKKKK